MKDVFSEKELVDLEYFIKDMGIKVGYDSQNFAVTNGCATYYLYLDGFEQRTCLFKPSYFGRNPKGNWIAVDFIIGKNGNCVLGTVRNIDPSVAKNSSNYSDFYNEYVGKYWKFDVPHDFFDYMNESKKYARKSIKESINANSILSKVETIVGKTKIKHPKAEIIELDGTKYIYYSYFDRGFDDDALDRVWDKCSDLKGVVDVGFGYGYGLKNTKYENSLLIELDDDVIVESKKSVRKSIKESRGQTIAELLQYASPNTKVHIYTKITNDEFEGTVDELKSKHAEFLYDTIMIWSNLNHNNVVEIYCY